MDKEELEKELDEAYKNFWEADGKVHKLLSKLKNLDKTKNLSKLIGKCYKTSKTDHLVDNYFKIIDTTAPHGHLVLVHIKKLSISIEKMTEPSFYAQEIGAITEEEFNRAYENTKEEIQKCIENSEL